MRSLFFATVFKIVLVTGLLIIISGCDTSNRSGNTTTNPVVQEKSEALLNALKAREYEKVILLYPESFFSKLAPEDWLERLKSYGEDRGLMHSFRLVKSQADTRFSGKFFILEYTVVHEGQKRANHLITYLSPVEGGEIKIIGHKITPWLDERSDEIDNSLNGQKKP